MVEFQDVIKNWIRMCKKYTTDNMDCCKGCPLEDITEHGCGAIFDEYFADVVDWPELERRVMQWAVEYPEPVYETWFEYLLRIGVIPVNAPVGGEYQWIVESIKHKHISNDIAESLKLHPKEVQS